MKEARPQLFCNLSIRRDHQDRVVAGNGASDFRPIGLVERDRDGVCIPWTRAQHQQILRQANIFDEFGHQCRDFRPARRCFPNALGVAVACLDQAKLANITR